MEETSFFALAEKEGIRQYRFTCLRTFHKPFCIVLQMRADGTGTLTRKVGSGRGGYQPAELTERVESAVDQVQVDSFEKLMESEGFWKLPSTVRPEGIDGAIWIVEAVQGGRYHIVSRWSPREKTPIGKLGRRLLELADWKVDERY
jgi:hypothetical protein